MSMPSMDASPFRPCPEIHASNCSFKSCPFEILQRLRSIGMIAYITDIAARFKLIDTLPSLEVGGRRECHDCLILPRSSQ